MQYETEEQQVEALKEWWSENGKAVIMGIALGVLLVIAWTWWKSSQEKKAVAASDNFSETMEALQAGDYEKVSVLSKEAKEDHDGTLYAAYTSLSAARAAVEQGNLEQAASELQWAVDNAELEDVSVIARVRLARVKGAMGDAAGGLDVLPSKYSEGFTALIEEARGDLLGSTGDAAAAKTAYQAALDSNGSPDPGALRMKLNELATLGGKS